MAVRFKKTAIPAIIFIYIGNLLFASAPLAYIIPDTKAVHIILGDVPRNVAAFTVARKDKNSKEFKELTKEPVRPLSDPLQAVELMGKDYSWISRRVGLEKPSRLWRKLQADKNTALSLCLVSPGLRMALGRTLIDVSVEPGAEYTYRVDLLDMNERKINSITQQVKVEKAAPPQPVQKVAAEVLADEIKISWDYAPYRDSAKDLAVSFNIYRIKNTQQVERINQAPVLRIEGWLSFLDNAIEYGSSFTYFVEPVDMIGNAGTRGQSAVVQVADKTPPLVPMGLTAVDVPEGVKLVWRIAPEPDAASYSIYRSDKLDAGYKKINTTPVPFARTVYLDTGMQRGICYYYKITAFDTAGNESPLSGPAAIIPRDAEAPAQIKELAFSVDQKKLFVALTWQESAAPDLNGYHIYRGKSKNDLTRITGAPVTRDKKGGFTDTGFRDKGLFPGDLLVYAVSAVDSSFNEGDKAFIEVRVPDNKPPSAVFAFSAKTTADGKAALTWQPSLSRDLDKHRIFRKENNKATYPQASADFVQVAELTGKITGWIDAEVTCGRQYAYQIVEVDTAGNQSAPSAVVNVIPTDVQSPPAPAGVTGVIESKGVRLEWKAVAVSDLAGYRVYRLTAGPGSRKLLTPGLITLTTYLDASGKAGTTYGITAVDTSGNEGEQKNFLVTGKEGGK